MASESDPALQGEAMDATDFTLLVAVLDRIIPRSGIMPGAGEAGVATFIQRELARDIGLAGLFAMGLEQISSDSLDRGAPFTDLPDHSRDEVLRGIEATAPEFFSALIKHTYGGYYTDRRILGLLGDDGRPPQPSGHTIERGDLSLLEAVRNRGAIYRRV